MTSHKLNSRTVRLVVNPNLSFNFSLTLSHINFSCAALAHIKNTYLKLTDAPRQGAQIRMTKASNAGPQGWW